jgi:hypothetical protein
VSIRFWSGNSQNKWGFYTIGLGKNRGDHTVVHLAFDTGERSRRLAGELFWRKPELRDKDKPGTNDKLDLTQPEVQKIPRRRGRIIDLTTPHKGPAISIIGARVPPGTFKQGKLFN